MHRLFRARLSLALRIKRRERRAIVEASRTKRTAATIKRERREPPPKSVQTISFALRNDDSFSAARFSSKYWKRDGRGTLNADNKIPRCDEQMQPSKRAHRLHAGIHRCIFSSPRATLNSLSLFLSCGGGGGGRHGKRGSRSF